MSFASHRSLIPLYEAPKALPQEWKAIFSSLVEPLRRVHYGLQNPSVSSLSGDQLKDTYIYLSEADDTVQETMDQIDGIAQQTWEAGYQIRMAVGPILEKLFDVPPTPRLPTDLDKRNLEESKKHLYEMLKTFDARPLLLTLKRAVTAECRRRPSKQGGRPSNDDSPSRKKQQWCYDQYKVRTKKLSRILVAAKKAFGRKAPKTEGEIIIYAQRWAKHKNLPIPRRN